MRFALAFVLALPCFVLGHKMIQANDNMVDCGILLLMVGAMPLALAVLEVLNFSQIKEDSHE